MLLTIKSRFNYDPETGIFIYKHNHNRMKKGDTAGRANTNGHIQISVDGKRYMAHNLAWLYMTGQYPDGFIVDHKDRNYSNNKWENLRKASLSQNSANTKLAKSNKSGLKGVSWNKNKRKWIAQIGYQGKKKWIGAFDSKEDAKEAYDKIAKDLFGEFANV